MRNLFYLILALIPSAMSFLLMSFLISPDQRVPDSLEPEVLVEFTRKLGKEQRDILPDELPNPPDNEKTPPPPQLIKSRPPVGNNLDESNSGFDKISGGVSDGINILDQRATAMFRFPPQYPAYAEQRGIEGWVLVEFTISISGTVLNARVVDSNPKGIFEKATLRALKKWKYKPKKENGAIVEQVNIREIFRFQLENSQRG